MVLLFDAANTLIHKPAMYTRFIEILKQYSFDVDLSHFRKVHKLISECNHFPDKTSKDFYNGFNKEILYGLGIIPTGKMLDEIFNACSYLPWEKFDDTRYITDLPVKKAVLSNFHNGLDKVLKGLFGTIFIDAIISETEKIRKPDPDFFQKAIERLGVAPSEIIYIGDSVKLDMEPASRTGMNAWLIDRDNNYPYYSQRLQSMTGIKDILTN